MEGILPWAPDLHNEFVAPKTRPFRVRRGNCDIEVSVSRSAVFGFGVSGIGSVVYSFVLYKGIELTRRDLERAAISRGVEGYSITTIHYEFALLINLYL